MIEPSVSLYGQGLQRVTDHLGALLQKSHSLYAMLIDRKGFVLAHRESLWAPRPPSLDSIATLVAGNFATTAALARMLGETKFTELVHQGEKTGLYLEEVDDRTLLLVVFDQSTPIGRVKLFVKKAVADVGNVLRESPADKSETDAFDFGDDFTKSVDALLDDLFKE